MIAAPTLRTGALTLRPYTRADFGAYAAFLGSDRAKPMGGPLGQDAAWAWFTNDAASWSLHGFGCLTIWEARRRAGFCGIVHPPHFPEPQCGWALYGGFTGRGIAARAVAAILADAFASGLRTAVSYIRPGNAASRRVAERCGARLDAAAPRPAGSRDLVYRFAPVAA